MLSISPQADRVLLSVNPMAGAKGSSDRVERLVELAEAAGLKTEICSSLDEVSRRANALHTQKELRALVAVGGDGTVAELANRTAPGLPLAILPAGTENLLARHLRIDGRPESLVRTILGGATMHLDAGLAAGRLFLIMVSCGFDADVVRRFHQRRLGHVRKLYYLRTILESIARYPFPEIQLYWDEDDPAGGPVRTREMAARWVFAFNLPRYAGRMRFAPQADGTDGRLDLCVFHCGGLWHGLKYAGAVRLGCHRYLPDCSMFRARRLRITSPEPVPYQLDGDPGGNLPLDLEVLPGRVTLLKA